MELNSFITSIESVSLDTETTLANQIDLVIKAIHLINEFNKINEQRFHFQTLQDQKLGELLYNYLNRACCYLDRVEQNETSEHFQLTDVYYELSCHCLNTIRILSRDTDVIGAFHHHKLLDILQNIADLKDLRLNDTENQKIVAEPNFNSKETLTITQANIILKTRERSQLIHNALKSMSNLIYNSKYIQEYYATNKLATNITIYLRNLLKSDSIYLNTAEYDIVLFKLKLLFLMTVFVKSVRPIVCDKFNILATFSQCINKLQLSEANDCCLAVELLKTAYNITMDIESVRIQARDALSAIKPINEEFLNTKDSNEINPNEEALFCTLTSSLIRLLSVKSDLSVNPTKQSDLISHAINLLTNMPSFCFQTLIPETDQPKLPYLFENRDMKVLASILDFLTTNLQLYINQKQSADILYPVLMLCAVMAKSHKSIRHYFRSKVLPPLTKADLANLPQNGTTVRNFLIKMMTDPNLQLKRLCAQFLFILCKENVGRLIKYTGYGNAAGLLAEAGLMLSSHGDRAAYSSESDDSDSEDYKKLENNINVITGQAELDNESDTELLNEKEREARLKKKQRQDIFEGMTEEQKEYEAMQLANAIDKLTRLGSGIIKPATIGPDGRPVEIEHVLQLQENQNNLPKK